MSIWQQNAKQMYGRYSKYIRDRENVISPMLPDDINMIINEFLLPDFDKFCDMLYIDSLTGTIYIGDPQTVTTTPLFKKPNRDIMMNTAPLFISKKRYVVKPSMMK
jgi:hypothetical protein